jgi:hypothetical protein
MKIKEHFKKYKTVYIVVGTAVVTATITVIIMKKINIKTGMTGLALTGMTGLGESASSLVMENINNVGINNGILTQVINSYRQGGPAWVTRCLETGEVFSSQKSAALANNITESILSKHLNGLIENAKGLHFERICMAA